ncbi:MAG TPA: methylenetetrahydrofolate reductase [NAD(P)H] [Leptospiraceae bacterium]|nr:methylenetetrahydrofolate reductase [NAD(P)H] [Leptospiraceae bacterium]HNN02717.1 methylenetetrahydrofolate reductase [NAD(P)H] [Leptospiraceae bacterium]
MMKIKDIYAESKKTVYSFEFFPPKTDEGLKKLMNTVQDMKILNPGFISVTYGAGGSTKERTMDICQDIQSNFSIVSACHFTCVGADKSEILNSMQSIKSRGIDNVIALRGDPPKGQGKFVKTPGGFANATELIQFIRKEGFDFGIGGGCYPEKHPDSPTLQDDIRFLKLKADAGAEFLITQLFFSNSVFKNFIKLAEMAGIKVPVIPGIMPITSFSQIERFRELAACHIPEDLVQELTEVKDNAEKFLQRSLSFTVTQCRELLSMGVKGIHFYTLNQSTATVEILKELL